jgi:hypothetical protein
MKRIRLLSALALMASLVAVDAVAQGRGKGRGDSGAKGGANVTVIFTDAHRARVREYVVVHPMQLQALPPGIAKNVGRGKRLPPGIAKRAVPREILVLLPPPEPGVTFVLIGDMVVAERSGLVIDIMFRIGA